MRFRPRITAARLIALALTAAALLAFLMLNSRWWWRVAGTDVDRMATSYAGAYGRGPFEGVRIPTAAQIGAVVMSGSIALMLIGALIAAWARRLWARLIAAVVLYAAAATFLVYRTDRKWDFGPVNDPDHTSAMYVVGFWCIGGATVLIAAATALWRRDNPLGPWIAVGLGLSAALLVLIQNLRMAGLHDADGQPVTVLPAAWQLLVVGACVAGAGIALEFDRQGAAAHARRVA